MKVLLSVLLLTVLSNAQAASCWCHIFFNNSQIGDAPGNGTRFSGDNEKNCLNLVCKSNSGYEAAMEAKKNAVNIASACTGKPTGTKIDLKIRARVGANGGDWDTYSTLTCQSTVSCPQGSWADSNFPGKCVSGVPNTDGIKASGLRDQRLQNNEFFIYQGGLYKVSNTAVPLVSGSWSK